MFFGELFTKIIPITLIFWAVGWRLPNKQQSPSSRECYLLSNTGYAVAIYHTFAPALQRGERASTWDVLYRRAPRPRRTSRAGKGDFPGKSPGRCGTTRRRRQGNRELSSTIAGNRFWWHSHEDADKWIRETEGQHQAKVRSVFTRVLCCGTMIFLECRFEEYKAGR